MPNEIHVDGSIKDRENVPILTITISQCAILICEFVIGSLCLKEPNSSFFLRAKRKEKCSNVSYNHDAPDIDPMSGSG